MNDPRSFFFSAIAGYFLGFVLPWLLLSFNFVDAIEELSYKTNWIISIAIISYYFGVLFFTAIKPRFEPFKVRKIVCLRSEKQSIVFILIWTFVGVLCLFYEFYVAGVIPIFSGVNWERVRFDVQVNGYVHLIAVSTGMAAFTSYAFSTYTVKVVYRRGFLILCATGLIFVFLTGNRSDFLIPVVVIALFYFLRYSIRFELKHAIYLGVFLVVFGLIKLVREELSGSDYINMMSGQMSGKDFGWLEIILYPIYMTFAYSYQVLDWLVLAGASNMSSGEYTFYSIYSLLASEKITFGDYKNYVLGVDFYGELTSTYISNFYIDFGLFGCALGSFLMGWIMSYFSYLSRCDRRYDLLYVVSFLYLLLSFYSFMYYYFYCVLQIFLLAFVANFFLINSDE